jgi:hypothetical protein
MTTHGVGTEYLRGLLERAQATAASEGSWTDWRRAQRRIDRLVKTIEGIHDGRIQVGSRTPVRGLPAWVTLDVVRGGFATGQAAAESDLSLAERTVLDELGSPMGQGEVFRYMLTGEGLARLSNMLQSRSFVLDEPEQAALLVVAWLLGRGDTEAAIDVLETIAPFGGRLRFLPSQTNLAERNEDEYFRWSVGTVSSRIQQAREQPRVEAMREALLVWNPMLDRLFDLWCGRLVQGSIIVATQAWLSDAASLLDDYETAARRHQRCTKHRRPKENFAILCCAAQREVGGDVLTPRDLGRVRSALESMLAKRGDGGERHRSTRETQAAVGKQPSHVEFAPVVLARLSSFEQSRGISTALLDGLTGPLTEQEATGRIKAEMVLPRRYSRTIAMARTGTLDDLVSSGVVPSAEVLASFSPQLVAANIRLTYADSDLGAVMAANHEAFRRRRSLLLLNFEKQVQLAELPWVKAVEPYREGSKSASGETLRTLSTMSLRRFPGTLLPNPVVREFAALAKDAGVDVPFVEELAADIFMGGFSGKFLAAAKVAGSRMSGSLYARYYDIDYSLIDSFVVSQARDNGPQISHDFNQLCNHRTSMNFCGGSWIVKNGATIEQAQILTTHNLAPLLYQFGLFDDGQVQTIRAPLSPESICKQWSTKAGV